MPARSLSLSDIRAPALAIAFDVKRTLPIAAVDVAVGLDCEIATI
jgi:hypothetical protein